MTITEANRIKSAFYRKSAPTEEDVFIFTEALNYLIEETKDPHYMMELGGYYYGEKSFDLALKYYELAAEHKYAPAYDGLGYIWYYGRTGQRDYEKAFKYFSLSRDTGNLQAAYKVADMYKNGYYVEKNYEKYKEIIEELYPKVEHARHLGEPLPEIFTRLARIRTEEGDVDEAIYLYLRAKDFQAQRISYNAFFGDLNIMMWLIDDLYKLREFDREDFDFYDMYYLLKSPCEITFRRHGKSYTVRVTEEEGTPAIEFDGKWFRSREDFFGKAVIGSERLTAIYEEFYGFEVE
ncbi:MAG: sel1 repeat family protein [Lachnospiraceae bacterium]|nr:sel1 repeat family protein [Lachnospiraceae bacterium]